MPGWFGSLMITPDDYPVYNHRERPGIGRDHRGEISYNCFSIRLTRSENRYEPFLFSHFLEQYGRFPGYAGTCGSCIRSQAALSFSADGYEVDRSAVARKFSETEIDRAEHYFCPLLRQVLRASELQTEDAFGTAEPLPAKPIQAVLAGSWDSEYLFEFLKLGPPEDIDTCQVLHNLLAGQFVSTPAERSFFTMWILTMFRQMEAVRNSGQRVFLEESDFDLATNKLHRFLFPVPQVWVYVIPKAPPGHDWHAWEKMHREAGLPQRVDFLFTYGGARHLVEIDDRGHYSVRQGDRWIGSESQYRQTLVNTRLLRNCGFEVHRFTNQEILELYDPATPRAPNLEGFQSLLSSVGLDARCMVFL
ncbi:MAG: hypothetical protein ACO1SV_07995 [Fimbriimonas sp.]